MVIAEMSEPNAWSNPSAVGTANIVQMAAFLEERSRSSDSHEVNRKLCKLVTAKSGEYLLEVGSGSGVLCRMLAPSLLPDGYIVGVDISPEMALEAQKFALSAGMTSGINFIAGLANALPYSEASFDCAIAARLLLHVTDPGKVICEMARIVKPGGRIVVMDWDFDTVAVDHPDREQTRKLLHWRNDHHGGNNWSGRQLWRQMHDAGLQNLSVHPLVLVAHDESDGLTQSLWRAAQVACEGGAISEDEKEAWVKELKNRIQKGSFFASIVYFIVIGTVVSTRI